MRKSAGLVIFAVLVLVGLGVLLTRPAHRASAQGVQIDRSLVALLPANATTLVGVDVERLKGTALYQRLEAQTQQGTGHNQFDEFTAATGFDPRRDVQTLLVAAWPGPSSAGAAANANNNTQWVGVARGKFNVDAIANELRTKKATVEAYRGFQVFSPDPAAVKPPKDRVAGNGAAGAANQGAFTFLDANTAIAGARPALLAAIDRKLSGSGPSLADNASLLSRAERITGSSQIWVISDRPGDVVTKALPKDNSAQASNFARIFAGMQNSTFALDFMNGLDLKAAGLCKTPEDAKTLGDAARGFIAIGRLAVSQQNPELITLFDGIRVEERAAELDISVQVDLNTFEKLLDKAPGKRRSQNVSYRQ